MCGITGIYEYGTSQGAVRRDVVIAMRDTMRHRGPDGEGVFTSADQRVGLGHRRLAIVDPARGQQPMFGAQGESLVFNGEIYNYPRLRRELEQRGVEFVTDCDTEVILHLYALEGEACLRRLEGMFGLALWDPVREQLLLARDPVGEKPLYWTDVGGRLIFGSEIKALLRHPAVDAAVNTAAIAPYLANLTTSSPETLYAGISKLAPGTSLLCDSAGPRISSFAELFGEREWSAESLPQAARSVRTILERSVHDRLMSDVPVGVLLSGGLDSTTLVGLLHERARETASFSVGFDGRPDIDERDEARAVAAHFGTDHHEVVISEADAIGFLPRLVYHQDEPLADPVCVPLHFVCELAHENGVKVVLAGEGADELFWGYSRYRRVLRAWPILRTLLALPAPARRGLSRALGSRSRPQVAELLAGIAAGRLNPIHYPLGLSRDQRDRLLAGGSEWSPAPASNGKRETARQRMAFDTQEYEFLLRLPELLLMRIDRFSMSNSVEARVPFLAPDLVRLVYGLPLDYKLRRGRTKIVLREAISDVVPDWVLNRQKQGFGAPIFEWMGSRAGSLLSELLRDPELRRYFDAAAVNRLLDPANAAASAFTTWPILNFALWHRRWIQGEDLEPVIERLRPAGR